MAWVYEKHAEVGTPTSHKGIDTPNLWRKKTPNRNPPVVAKKSTLQAGPGPEGIPLAA